MVADNLGLSLQRWKFYLFFGPSKVNCRKEADTKFECLIQFVNMELFN